MHTDALSFVSIQFYPEKMCPIAVRLPPHTHLDGPCIGKTHIHYDCVRSPYDHDNHQRNRAEVNNNSFDCMQIPSMD